MRRRVRVASPDAHACPAVSLSDVAVTYPEAQGPAPRGASLTVEPGETVLLLGPSACGKSTLALTVNGLVPRSVPARVAGSLHVHGRKVSECTVAELSRDVGMVFQDVDAQIVMNTVFDEVAFGLENLCLPVPEVLARTEQAVRQAGLWERRDDDPAVLSGGQKQRLAIACALGMGAGVLVLDEPTANLDPAAISDVYTALSEVTADGEHAVLLIEHNVDAALTVADRVIVLDQDGSTRYSGTPADVFGKHGADIAALGIRLPAPTRLGLELRDVGADVEPLPVMVDELHHVIEQNAETVTTAHVDTDDAPASHTSAATVARDAAITLTDVTIRRGDRTILDGATFGISRGEFVGIVGVNGSGKTSLLQTIANLIRPTTGTVSILGEDVFSRCGRRRQGRVGYVFQNPEHQFVTSTVADELAVSLSRIGLSSEERGARVERELSRFGLTGARDRHPFLLSGGQKRRLSVATALIGGAEILLLDEPTFGQDQAYTDELIGMLEGLNHDGTTIVMVSHDLDLIAEHTTRTLVLADGRIRSDAPTDDTFDDAALLTAAGLRQPALAAALRNTRAPAWLVRTRTTTRRPR